MGLLSRDKIEITLYSSLIIVILELLFFRISPQLYSIVNTLPLLLIGLVIIFKQFFQSVTLSLFFVFLLNSSDFFVKNNFVSSKLLISQLLVSFLVLLFLGLIKFSKEKKISSGDFFSIYMLPLSFLLVLFLFFFFSKFDFDKNTAEIVELFSYTIKDSNLYNKIDIHNLIRNILKLLPSINLVFILVAIILNFFFAKYIITKLKLSSFYHFSFSNFKIPNWYFGIFTFIFLMATIFDGNLQYYFLNLTLFLSFIYFLDGIIFITFLQKKIRISSSLKILIIFLFFIFLGYVLILLVFFIGFFKNIKYFFEDFFGRHK